MESKKIYRSKTFWFNALTVLVVVASFFGYEQNQELATDVQTFIVTFNPLINIVLRAITNKAVSL
jgi:hypothetical protein